MTLHGYRGARKYVNTAERRRFLTAARHQNPDAWLFCLVLAWTGARLSEVLALTPIAFDLDRGLVSIVTLKRRQAGIVREVPLPPDLMRRLQRTYRLRERQREGQDERLWPWCRQTGWRLIKSVMMTAEVTGLCAMPKGLRHGFAVAALQALVPPPLVQRWLGHASLKTTGIYAEVSGPEEQVFAARLWRET